MTLPSLSLCCRHFKNAHLRQGTLLRRFSWKLVTDLLLGRIAVMHCSYGPSPMLLTSFEDGRFCRVAKTFLILI